MGGRWLYENLIGRGILRVLGKIAGETKQRTMESPTAVG